MSTTSTPSKPSTLLLNLATTLFYVVGFMLLGMMIMYVASRRSLYPLVALGYLSNYWAIPLFFTASLLKARNRDGWWLGMMLGGFFLLAGFPHAFGMLFALARGAFNLESLSLPSISRFVFGVVALLILSRPTVIDRIKYDTAVTCPNSGRIVAASGFGMGLYWVGNLALSSIFWSFMGGSFSFKGFLFPLSVGWTVLPIVSTVALFPIGRALLRGRTWAYYGALAFWGIVFAWSFVDVVVLSSKIARLGAWGMLLESPYGFLGIFVGGFTLYWLLRSEILTYVGLEGQSKKQLAPIIVVSATILIALAKQFTIPILSDIFLF